MRWVALLLVVACGSPPDPQTAAIALPADLPPPRPAPPPDNPRDKLAGLATEMCELANAAATESPLPVNRLKLERVELRGGPMRPDGRCSGVAFSIRSQLLDAPSSPARIAQTIFLVTNRRLVAHAHGVGSSPDIAVSPNIDAFPELASLHAELVSAVAENRAGAYQAAPSDCDDVGSKDEKCARDMSDPVATEDFTNAARDPAARRKALELDTVYVLFPARGALMRVELHFHPPVLSAVVERRD
jgi:hypothetical protein